MGMCALCRQNADRCLCVGTANRHRSINPTIVANRVAMTACGCGLPASLADRLDDLPFEALVFMSRMCPVRRGLCCVRTAALTKVFE